LKIVKAVADAERRASWPYSLGTGTIDASQVLLDDSDDLETVQIVASD